MHRSFYALAAFAAIAGAAAIIPACADQGEGERCDVKALNEGNDDCQSGLVCKHLISNPASNICCPQDPAQATTVICSGTLGLDSGPPPDEAGTPTDAGDASTADTGADSSADATPDTGVVDGGVDGSLDGAPDAAPDSASDANLDAPVDG